MDDSQTIINASECVSNVSEDLTNRSEIIRQGAVIAMLNALDKSDGKVQSSISLTLARCLQEVDGQTILAKQPGFRGILRLVELLSSKDINIARNAAYALSNATIHEPNAIAACNAGALESLLSLTKETTKHSTKFASEALEKIFNHRKPFYIDLFETVFCLINLIELSGVLDLSAKYWLKNNLSAENFMMENFYDVGFVGSNIESVHSFPTLQELQTRAVDKKREVILVDYVSDPTLATLLTAVTDSITGKQPRHQIRILGAIVAKFMGGVIDHDQLSEFGFKFRITEIKIKLCSNVIPIGQINQGTFYHRALLFKAICDRIGLSPCSLTRGEYNRAWNTVDIRKQVLAPKPVAPVKTEKAAPRSKISAQAAAASATASVPPQISAIEQLFGPSFTLPEDDFDYTSDEPAIVDLMFEPGKLFAIRTPEALQYQRIVD